MNGDDIKILSLDIGGSHIKATVLDSNGTFLQQYKKQDTPVPSSPAKIIAVIEELASNFPEYDKVAAGFPGYVKEGVVKTAPKLGNHLWQNYDLCKSLEQTLGRPAIVINDADLQGLSLATGTGLEMVITLGTGFGSAIIFNGALLPHLEMSLHPITKRRTYNDYLGRRGIIENWKKKME